MRFEYLLFDLFVLLPPFFAGFIPQAKFRARIRPLLWCCFVVAVPFILWDAAVAGRHWWFEPTRTLPLRVFGLPIEEMLFFIAVPYACVFTWQTVLHGERGRRSEGLRWLTWLVALSVVPGVAFFIAGREYTGAALFAFGLSAVFTAANGTRLFERPRYWVFLVVVSALGFVFNGFLTGRPIVLYGAPYFLGIRLGTVPLEDFVYGAALVTFVTALYEKHCGRVPARSWAESLVARRMSNFRVQLNSVNGALPERPSSTRTVAVLGGGLAGLSAAALLADRGFKVTLFEKNGYLGGKVGAWRERLPTGLDAPIEHGFHAFFRHYYNLNAFLELVAVRPKLASIGSYLILTREGKKLEFADERSTPVLNLLQLAQRGVYRFTEVAFGPAGRRMEAFLRYDRAKTFAAFDAVPFSEFSAQAQLPASLKIIFTTFARAFFAEDKDLSTAELIKSFHFYYLSHDRGLVYDYLDGSYDTQLLAPISDFLRARGAEVKLNTAVSELTRGADGELRVHGAPFDHVICALDVAAAKRLLEGSDLVASEDPKLRDQLSKMRAGKRYAVLRVWTDRVPRADVPVFISTERIGQLDAAAFVDRVDPECRAWASEHNGSVIELHSYAVTDAVTTREQVTEALWTELLIHLPELNGARRVHEQLQLRDDFTALHVGMAAHRPGVATAVRGLSLAGDWVALEAPAMLMEAAHTSGRLAANRVLTEEGLRETVVESVPLTGVLP